MHYKKTISKNQSKIKKFINYLKSNFFPCKIVHEKRVLMLLSYGKTKLKTCTIRLVILRVDYVQLKKKTFYIKNCTTRSRYVSWRMWPKFTNRSSFANEKQCHFYYHFVSKIWQGKNRYTISIKKLKGKVHGL